LRTHWKAAFAALSSAAALLAAAGTATAGNMDPTPDRLSLSPPGVNCQTAGPSSVWPANGPTCQPNNPAWANLMTELGYAIAPTAFHPARTTGFGGFALSLEASYAHINADNAVTNPDGSTTQYWHEGTRGPVDPNNHKFSIVNNSPDSILQIYTLKARKGLPLGFEITGALGYVANTSLWVGGADVHWAILEGYRTGVLGYLPDLAVGGGVRTLGGSPDFFLTTVGIDAEASKPITLADSAVLTPYVGAQRLYIFADSTVVNLAPGVDPLAQCGYQGKDPSTGQPICKNTINGVPNNGAFNNLVTFNKVRVERWRGIAGLTYRYGILYLAGQFAMDLEDPGAEGQQQAYGITGDRQWTTSFEIGLFF
jgi:hypothetical protein